jgi:diguanylate cyclase (GGDEF)-like protein
LNKHNKFHPSRRDASDDSFDDKETMMMPTFNTMESRDSLPASPDSAYAKSASDDFASFDENETFTGRAPQGARLTRTPPRSGLKLNTPVPNPPRKEPWALGSSFYLLVITGNMTGLRFKVNKNAVTLGRSASCDITLDAHDISRLHARITILPDQRVLLRDNNSTNGTFVNNERIQKIELKEGMNIQFGKSTILSVQRKRSSSISSQLACITFDPLTQVYNREYFEKCFKTEFNFSTNNQTPLSLLILDVDNLGRINDRLGTSAGDEVLKAVAKKISELLGEEDFLARYREEEFAIIARGTLPTRASLLAREIQGTIENMQILTISGLTRVTVSIGVVTMHTQLFDDRAEMLREAYERLYQAKREGQNRVVDRSDVGFW